MSLGNWLQQTRVLSKILLFVDSSAESCIDALEMKNKRIPDKNITASTSKSKDNSPHFARLDSPKAWCSSQDDKLPFIQIQLKGPRIITGITTQGSSSDWAWVTKYGVKFRENGTWKEYHEELAGNNNIRGVKLNALDPPIKTQSIRIYPKDPMTLDNTDPKPCCLRLELRGCSAPDCGPLKKPDHGDIIEQVAFTYGNRIVFKCTETGYEMRGSRVRICQIDGTWNGSPTTCEIVQCGDPGTIQNGSQTVTKGFMYGGSVEFKCDKGYTLVGTRIIYCRADKQWSAAVPHCRDFCQSHAAGVHANPDNCFGFIMCDKAGTTHEMPCPAGLKFNPATLVCDWPKNVECENAGSGKPAG